MRGAAAFAEPPHIEGKRIDSSPRQLHGHIVPCLTCPVGLMEQQDTRAWLGCGKVACLQEGTVRRLQVEYAGSRLLLLRLTGARNCGVLWARAKAAAARVSTVSRKKTRLRFIRVTLTNIVSTKEYQFSSKRTPAVSLTFPGWRAAQFRSSASTPPSVRSGRMRGRR